MTTITAVHHTRQTEKWLLKGPFSLEKKKKAIWIFLHSLQFVIPTIGHVHKFSPLFFQTPPHPAWTTLIKHVIFKHKAGSKQNTRTGKWIIVFRKSQDAVWTLQVTSRKIKRRKMFSFVCQTSEKAQETAQTFTGKEQPPSETWDIFSHVEPESQVVMEAKDAPWGWRPPLPFPLWPLVPCKVSGGVNHASFRRLHPRTLIQSPFALPRVLQATVLAALWSGPSCL